MSREKKTDLDRAIEASKAAIATETAVLQRLLQAKAEANLRRGKRAQKKADKPAEGLPS